jgi:hypothetical protein
MLLEGQMVEINSVLLDVGLDSDIQRVSFPRAPGMKSLLDYAVAVFDVPLE